MSIVSETDTRETFEIGRVLILSTEELLACLKGHSKKDIRAFQKRLIKERNEIFWGYTDDRSEWYMKSCANEYVEKYNEMIEAINAFLGKMPFEDGEIIEILKTKTLGEFQVMMLRNTEFADKKKIWKALDDYIDDVNNYTSGDACGEDWVQYLNKAKDFRHYIESAFESEF